MERNKRQPNDSIGTFKTAKDSGTTKQHDKGRFPANIMHNGLEEDWDYCPKTSKAEKDKGLDSFETKRERK